MPGQTAASKIRETDKQIQRIPAVGAETCPGTSPGAGKTETGIDKLLESWCRQVRERKTPGGSNFTSRRCTRPRSEYCRKIPSGFWQGEGKMSHFEIHQILLFFLVKLALRRNFYWSLTYLGEGKYPTPALSSLLHGGREKHNSSEPQPFWSTLRGQKTEKLSSQFRYSLTKRLIPNHRIMEHIPLPPHFTTLLNADI